MNSNHKKTKKQHLSTATIVEQFNSYWVLVLIVMLVGIFIYYWLEWHTFSNFVIAMDRSPQFMYDFIAHYFPMGNQILHNPVPVEGYFYTTFFALLIEPIGKQTLPVAMVIWGGIQFLCLVALCIFSARSISELPQAGVVFCIGLCITSFPILNNIKWGQVSLLITVCIITAFLAFKLNKKVLAGILLGFATAIKLYPLYFIVYFLLKRDIRTCWSFGLSTFGFYFLFPATVLGFENWLNFEKTANEAIINSGWVARDINSQYIVHVGSRWFNLLFERPAGEVISGTLAIFGYMVALSCIVIVWLLQKTKSPKKNTLSLVALFLITPFVLKTSWPHYFVYLPFCQVAILLYCFATNPFGKLLYVLPVLSILLSSIFLFNLFPDWSLYNTYGILFLSNLFLLIAIYLSIFKLIRPTD